MLVKLTKNQNLKVIKKRINMNELKKIIDEAFEEMKDANELFMLLGNGVNFNVISMSSPNMMYSFLEHKEDFRNDIKIMIEHIEKKEVK